ncbi:unnamed protein product, partial [Lepidochelys olivacea]
EQTGGVPGTGSRVLPSPKNRAGSPGCSCPAMQWVVKLYLLGALLSLLSVLFGLMDSLDSLMAPQGLEQCLSSPWMEPGGSLAEGQPKILQGQAKRRTNKAFGSYL